VTAPAPAEIVEEFAKFGIRAFTTGREWGSFGLHTSEPVAAVTQRWAALRRDLSEAGKRFATASQVHGNRVVVHGHEWEGWLRVDGADGHVALSRPFAAAVTIADCVPVFIAHPGGAIAVLHSGWRGTAARIVERGIEALVHRGLPASELRLHLGPAICGTCYEVSADVYSQLTGRDPEKPTTVDLRALIADHARALGVRHITTSPLCTRCDNAKLFSHRAGDPGRQLAVVASSAP
jgi:YfiH family protein